MTELGDAVRQSVALLYAHKGKRPPDKPTLKIILSLWVYALKEFPPETILAATARACVEEAFPELHHVVAACRLATGEKHWFDAFEELVRITKESPEPPGTMPESVARGYVQPKEYAARCAIQSHPSKLFRKVGLTFLDSFFRRDEAPNLDVLRSQFQKAYDSAQKAMNLQSLPPLLMNEGEQRAIPV